MIKSAGLDLEEKLIELGRATETDGMIWRACFTENQTIGKTLIKEWMTQAGLSCYEDEIGNLIGRVEGKSSRTIMIGSHMDTVKDGGRYDGAAGILIGIKSVEELIKKKESLKYSIEVIAFQEEEASRFLSGYLGSKYVAGKLGDVELNDKDSNGQTLSEVMIINGYDPMKLRKSKREDLIKYLEVHIEQGRVLEASNHDIGIVENIVGVYAYQVTIKGRQDHAGTTPMAIRRDPMYEASKFIFQMTEQVKKLSSSATFTIGQMFVKPNISNVIPREVEFTIDLRDVSKFHLESIEKDMNAYFDELRNNDFEVHVNKLCSEEPIHLDDDIKKDLYEASENLEFRTLYMNSGAGHDAQIIADVIPTGLIFIPSKDGRSHSPEEYSSPKDLDNGMKLLTSVLEHFV